MRLFAGSREAYGTYSPEPAQSVPGIKVEIRSSARTVRGLATEEIWQKHLSGTTPLGMIPIDENDRVRWGCIDVDRYDTNHAELAAKIKQLSMPLLVTRSKSGGAHIFLFLSEPSDTALVQAYLRARASELGVGGSEIFPKQTKLLRDRGDVGNWIVMPYFGQTQEAVRHTGATMLLSEFLSAAERLRVGQVELIRPHTLEKREDLNSGPITDGPPCLQLISSEGWPEGTRNTGLMALGVYCKKRWPDSWTEHLEQMNRTLMSPPLPGEEVMQVISRLRAKEYRYQCKTEPLVSRCNSQVCRLRRYGIADVGSVPFINSLSVLESDPPIWFADVGDYRVELTTDQLITYREFQKACMEKLLVYWTDMRQADWGLMLSKAMESVVRIDTPVETKTVHVFQEQLEQFLTNRTVGHRMEDLLSQRPVSYDDDDTYIFRLQDLDKHLLRNKINMTRGAIVARLRDLGADRGHQNIKGRGVTVWTIPRSIFQRGEKVSTPSLPPEVM